MEETEKSIQVLSIL